MPRKVDGKLRHGRCLSAGDMQLPVHIKSGNGMVQAFCPDLPGCSASSATIDDALELLRRRVREYFASSAHRAPAGTRIVILEV